MKKNLIGAVAAGLALALAFTACESGSDTAFSLSDYTEEAVKTGASFTYVATPNSYTAIVKEEALGSRTYWDNDHEDHVSGTTDIKGFYSWKSLINGKNAYNSITSATEKGSPDGKTVGDVINTEKYSVTFNTKDNTWTRSIEKTTKNVYKLVAANYASGSNPPADRNYLSTKSARFYVDTTALGNTYNAGSAGTYTADDHGVRTYTYATAPSGTIVKDLEVAKDSLIAVIKNQLAVIEQIKADKGATEESARKAIADLNVFYTDLAFADGADTWISETSEVDGVTTNTETYLKGTATIATYKNETGYKGKDVLSGTYKLVSGNYKTAGEILITSTSVNGVTVVFDDDKGTYTLNGTGPFKIADDYKEATSSTEASANPTETKKGRTLKINGGVITSNAVVNRISGTSVVVTQTSFLVGDSYNTYAAAKDDATSTTSYTTRNTSYNYVLK